MPWQIPYAKDSLALAKSHRLMPTQRLAGPLRLESGEVLNPVTSAYEIHGVPRADGHKVVVVCHTCLLYTFPYPLVLGDSGIPPFY